MRTSNRPNLIQESRSKTSLRRLLCLTFSGFLLVGFGPALGRVQGGSPNANAAYPLLDVDPLAITSEMRTFVEERIGTDIQKDIRLRLLQEAIFDPDEGLGIIYGTHGTFSAANTFTNATGNCLSFTLLFVTLARQLGLNPYFVEVDEVTGWSQRGDVNFSHWHMYAEVELSNGVIQVDFLPWDERRYRSKKRIDEDRVRAHFFNNVGAQKVRSSGAQEEALAYFRKSLEYDPTFTPAKVNMAVAFRRSGQFVLAEKKLLEVLDQSPNNPQAASNLAILYEETGRDRKADKWRKQRIRYQDQNPFHHFRLGLQALGQNRPKEAKSYFKKAIFRQKNEAVFHQKLAEAYVHLEETSRARASLKRALNYAQTPDQKRTIEAQLQALIIP